MDQLLKVLAALPEDLAVVCSPHIRLVSTLYSHCKLFAALSPGALTHKYVQIYLNRNSLKICKLLYLHIFF